MSVRLFARPTLPNGSVAPPGPRGGLTTFARFSAMHGKANRPVSAQDRQVLETLRDKVAISGGIHGDVATHAETSRH